MWATQHNLLRTQTDFFELATCELFNLTPLIRWMKFMLGLVHLGIQQSGHWCLLVRGTRTPRPLTQILVGHCPSSPPCTADHILSPTSMTLLPRAPRAPVPGTFTAVVSKGRGMQPCSGPRIGSGATACGLYCSGSRSRDAFFSGAGVLLGGGGTAAFLPANSSAVYFCNNTAAWTVQLTAHFN